jgi:DNA replication protein DnaC
MPATTDESKTIQDFLKDFAERGFPTPRTGRRQPKEFVQEFEVCSEHGKWPTNTQDAEGVIRWNPPGCPVCIKQAQTQALVANADISQRFMHCTFENYRVENSGQQTALNLCRDYAKNFKKNRDTGRCLILRGNPGTGKNHLSAAIMLEIVKSHFTTLRIKANAYLDEYWAKDFSERETWVNRMANVDLLVIDEIGRASNSKSANDAFFRLIDARYEAVRPTIVISNLDRDNLRETLGAAAYDRLSEGGGSRIDFNWSSDRGRND